MVYADTSFLVSLYLTENHSETALRYLRENPKPIFVTSWNEIEILTAFSLNAHFGRITELEKNSVIQRWEKDLSDRFFITKSVPEATLLAQTKKFLLANRSSIPARSLDLVHIASALTLKTKIFLTFDKRQTELAKKWALHTPLS